METLPEYAVLDGAIGTEIIKAVGDDHDRFCHLWSSRYLVDREDVIIPVHKAYLENGADMIMTNTYKPTVEMFMRIRDKTREESMELFRKAARLACNARDEFWEKNKEGTKRIRPLVIGSQVCYGGRTYSGDEYVGAFVDNTSFEEIVEGHREKTQALLEGGVDILGFETMPCADEGRAIAELMKDFPGSKAWMAFSCKDGKHTCHGELFRDAALTSLLSDQIVAVGINCSKPGIITDLLKEIPPEVKEKKKIIVYPNSGHVWEAKKKYWYSDGEESRPLHEYIPEWIEHGANWIGGCCNVDPDEISKIRAVMKDCQKVS